MLFFGHVEVFLERNELISKKKWEIRPSPPPPPLICRCVLPVVSFYHVRVPTLSSTGSSTAPRGGQTGSRAQLCVSPPLFLSQSIRSVDNTQMQKCVELLTDHLRNPNPTAYMRSYSSFEWLKENN